MKSSTGEPLDWANFNAAHAGLCGRAGIGKGPEPLGIQTIPDAGAAGD